jgi:hypothetical protein
MKCNPLDVFTPSKLMGYGFQSYTTSKRVYRVLALM